jgi:hypothetical protein
MRWKEKENVSFEFLTTVTMRSIVVWHVTPCCLVEVHCQKDISPPSSWSKSKPSN